MSWRDTTIIKCPTCGHEGSLNDFYMSLSDECFCPAEKGCEWFLFGGFSSDDDIDEDEE